jgi:hypothetical protein
MKRVLKQSMMKGRTLPFLSVTFASILIGSSYDVFAYKLLEWDWRYQANPIEGAFVVCTTGAPSGASQVTKDAARKWSYTKFRFTFGVDSCPNSPAANYVEFGALADPGKTAETSTPNEPVTNRMKKCVIRFNVAKSWYVGSGTPSSTQNDLFSVALHEFGHCVGLDDVSTPGVVMTDLLQPGQVMRELKADDIAGRNKVYGVP